MYNSDIYHADDVDLVALESMLDAQTAELDSLLADMDDDIAMEGLFSKPKSAEQMIAKVKKMVDKKCKSKEDCDDLMAKLKAEESKYNDSLAKMKDAAQKFKDGEIDKKGMKAIIQPAAKELKKTCSLIALSDVNAKTDNVTDDEIQKLRDFLTGAEDVIKEKADSFGGEDIAGDGTCESFLDSLDYDEIATEALDGEKEKVNTALDAMKRGLASVCKKMVSVCKTKRNKCTDKGHQHSYKFWDNMYNFFNDAIQKILQSMSPDSLEKWKERINAKKKECDEHNDENGSESFVGDAYDTIVDVAFEEYRAAVAEYDAIAMEAYGEVSFSDFVDAATEGLAPDAQRAWRMATSEATRKINAIYKEAKTKGKASEYADAIKLLEQAKKGYAGLKSSANKLPDKVSSYRNIDGSDTNKGMVKATALNWINKKISDCDNLIAKYKNAPERAERKAGEASAKAARKEQKAADKAAKKAAKADKSDEAVQESLMDLDILNIDLDDVIL